jgi:hypothetical protein
VAATEHPLTRADFDRTGWEALLDKAEKREAFSYSMQFLRVLREVSEASNATATAVYTVLFVVTDVELRADNPDEPFGPKFARATARTSVPWDLTDDQFTILREIAPDIKDSEMRARVSDLVWTVKRGDIRLARLAVAAYLESADRLEDATNWVAFEDRVRRALRLSKSLGRGETEEFKRVIAYIEATLARLNGDDPSFLSCRLSKLLCEQKQGDPATYAAFAEKAARRAEGESEFYRARHYWGCGAGWHGRAKDLSQRNAALIAAADTHVTEAELAANFPPERSPNLSAAGHLRLAYHALQRIGTPAAIRRSKDVYRRLVSHQEKSVAEMKSASFPVDMTEMVRLAESEVSGKTLEQALLALARLTFASKKAELRKLVEESYARHHLLAIFSSTKLTSTGKITGERPHFETTGEAREEAVRAEMFTHAVNNRSLIAQGYLVPAIQKMREEHAPLLADFYQIAANSRFVPHGREMTYAKGLLAGFRGELDVAMHLLVPQIEESIRMLLTASGVITSGFDRTLSQQNEHDLNTTLLREEMHQILDENTVFELRGLLVEHYGSNLRNYMAHGMYSDHQMHSTDALYLWGLTLKLCMFLVPPDASGAPTEENNETAPEEKKDGQPGE